MYPLKARFRFFNSFRHKILMLFFAFAFVIGVAISFLLYNISANILKQQMSDSMNNNLINIANSFDSVLRSANDVATELSFNPAMIANLQQKPSLESYDYLVIAQETRRLLEQARSGNNIIKSIYAVSADLEYFYKTKMDRTYTASEISGTDWAEKLSDKYSNVWLVLAGNNLTEREPEYTLTAVKPVRNASMTKILGYIVMNIGFDDIRNYFQSFSFGDTGFVIVYNEFDELVFHPDARLNGLREPEILPLVDLRARNATIYSSDSMITYKLSAGSGLLYAARVPLSEVVSPAKPVRDASVLLLLICLVAALIYAFLISRQIFKPISVLVRHMEKAGAGDTNVQITEVRSDEMGILYQSFNNMVLKIRSLINELYIQEMLAKELKLINMQIQLNPHFLYNTLDAIHWTARENNMDEVCEMTFLLSKYFHKNLSGGKDFVEVSEAADITESYIRLQQIRFMDKFTYTVHIDEEIKHAPVPKYLFQPLVENAIVHGIEKKAGAGVCDVLWTMQDRHICFSVIDNGVGIPPDKLDKIRRMLADGQSDTKENFALRNINLQLQLYYGVEYVLNLDSEQGHGTRVSFKIPLKREGGGICTD